MAALSWITASVGKAASRLRKHINYARHTHNNQFCSNDAGSANWKEPRGQISDLPNSFHNSSLNGPTH